MSVHDRADLLRRVAPDVYSETFPEGRLAYESLKETQNFGIRVRDLRFPKVPLAFWLTIPALTEDPSAFLGLLYNRTHYTPEEWAPFDCMNQRLAWESGALEVQFLPDAINMVSAGDINFVILVEREQEIAHRWDIIGYPRGKLVIEGQAYITKVDRQVSEGIVEEIDLPPEHLQVSKAGRFWRLKIG